MQNVKGFLNKVRRQSPDEGAGAPAGVETAPKADVSIPAKKERRWIFYHFETIFSPNKKYDIYIFFKNIFPPKAFGSTQRAKDASAEGASSALRHSSAEAGGLVQAEAAAVLRYLQLRRC